MEAPYLLAMLYLLPLSLIVLGINVPSVSGQCQADQQSLLLNLKGSLTFYQFGSLKLMTWDPRRDCCGWESVSCDPGGLGHVVGLDLSYESIYGWTPSGIFGQLRYLQSLNLGHNNFNTTMPSGLENLTELVHLNLKNAGFIGQVPAQLSQMTNLVTLDLSFSIDISLTYTAESSLALDNPNLSSLVRNLSKLTELYLDGISLSGQENGWWQALTSSLPNLQVLSLSNCNLSGHIDDSMKNLKFLSSINLSHNNFSTPVLDTILQVPSLETLDLSDNGINCYFPEFHQNQSLKNLILSGTTISGGLPQSIGYLKNLSRVELTSCNLTGTIQSLMENLTQVVYLDLRLNQLTGVVPSLLRFKNLKTLALAQNQLSGEIPEFPSASTSLLDILDLSGNNLVGPIPSSIFDLNRLNFLALSYNKLNGSIQLDWVRKLVNLTSLDLSYNSLTVELSSSESNLTSFPQITTFKLASCNLTKFPDLGNQSNLERLDLSNNNIPEILPWLEKFANGSLRFLNLSCNLLKSIPEPTDFGNLFSLDVHGNQLGGEIPPIPSMIAYVDYSSNNFNSSTLLDMGKNLISPILFFFSLANNSLSGGIPESMCNAISLAVLDLSNNILNGTIPACLIGNLLGVLDLRGNRLSSTVPDNFQVECGLQTLNLNGNALHGKVPRTLANCTQLEVLDLGNNQINDAFPCDLRDHLPNLRVLILRNNQFHGQIDCPAIQGSWDKLQIVDLALNQFSGTLPEGALLAWKAMMEAEDGAHDRSIVLQASGGYYQDSIMVTYKGVQFELVKILTYFTTVDLSCNRFEGQLPEAIGQFSALYLLNLSHNSFNGPILPSIGNLSQLESLDLSSNNLGGPVPQQLAALSFLSFLNVSDNKLTGEIPKGTQLQSFSASSFEDNVGLCGPPLPQSCHHIGESMVPPSSAYEENEEDGQFMLAAGMGFVVGAAAIIAPLIYDKTLNRWYDYHVNRIYMMLVSYFSRG